MLERRLSELRPTPSSGPGESDTSLARRHVFAGKAAKSKGGLDKSKLVKNKSGKIDSKASSARGEKHPWMGDCASSSSSSCGCNSSNSSRA